MKIKNLPRICSDIAPVPSYGFLTCLDIITDDPALLTSIRKVVVPCTEVVVCSGGRDLTRAKVEISTSVV